MANISHITLNGSTYDICDATARSNITSIGTDISDINGAITNINGSITSINSEITNMKSAGVTVCVSDSYGDRENGWVEEYATLNPDETVVKACASGFGFSVENGTFVSLITPGATGKSVPVSLDRTTVKKIIVAGGFNDSNRDLIPTATVDTAISGFMTYAKANYVNAKVYIGFIGWSFNNYYVGKFFADNAQIAYKNCAKYGAIYMNGVEYIMHNRDLFLKETPFPSGEVTENYNYIHPNSNGSKALASGITQAIKGGKCSVEYEYINVEYTPASNVTDFGSVFAEQLIDNRCYFLSTGFAMPCNFSVGLGQQRFKIGTSKETANSYLCTASERNIPVLCIGNKGGTLVEFTAQLVFSKNDIYLEIEGGHTISGTITQINSQNIRAFVDIER